VVDRDLGGAAIGPTNTAPDVQEDARRYLIRNGHSDLLTILGLETDPEVECPHCRKRPWLGNYGGTLCQRKECRTARRLIDAAKSGEAV